MGKDTLYAALARVDPRFRPYAHARAIKEELAPLIMAHFGIDPRTATGAQKELIRPMLIAWGCAQRAVNPDHWVAKTVAQIQEDWGAASPFYAPFIPVVTDNRFVNEIEMLRRTYGSALRHIDVTRDGSPPPTEEETKHFEAVAALADHHLHWGGDDDEAQIAAAREIYHWLGLDAHLETAGDEEAYG